MVNLQETSTTMKLLPLLCLCLLTHSGRTFTDGEGAAPEPSVTILKSKDGAVLQCAVRGASPKPVVEWRDGSGNILSAKEAQVTERGGSYDIILQTTVTKSDTYSCVVTQKEINHQTEAEIYVPLSGAASKPFVSILDETKDWSLLQCEVLGASPKPVVEWRDSSRNILPAKEAQVTERGGSYDIILQTTVTKSDTYRCVVTQTELNHRTEAETYVHISESSTGWIVAGVLAVFCSLFVIVGVVQAVLFFIGRISCKSDEEKVEPPKDPSHSELLHESS